MPALLAGFVSVPAAGTRLWVRTGLEAAAAPLLAAWAGEAGEWVGGGRAAHPVVALPGGGQAVVRRYRRGGAVRHLNRDRYFLGDRAVEEASVTEAARAASVRVPEVVAVGRRRAGIGYRAMLATRRIEGAVDLAHAGDPAALLERVGEQIAAMHAAGIAHPDLNLGNVLVDPSGAVWLIDFDRARRYTGAVPPARRRADLLRFERSRAKLGVPLSPQDREALAAGYGTDWPLARG